MMEYDIADVILALVTEKEPASEMTLFLELNSIILLAIIVLLRL